MAHHPKTKEADPIDFFIFPSTVGTYEKTLGFTEMFTPLGAVTIALYL